MRLRIRWIVAAMGWCLFSQMVVGAGEPPLPPLQRSEAATPFLVREFRFVGNKAFANQELARIVSTYTNRPISGLELEQARIAVTTWYIQHGYVNSGAIIEKWPDADGVVTLKIVEGNLTEVNLSGNKWLLKRFYERRLGMRSGRPLNVNDLRNMLRLWREVYPIEQVNAELRPGTLPGQATLDLKVKERFPFHLGAQYANDRPPSTGAEQVTGLLRADSLTGYGDRLSLDYGIARGSGSGMDRPRWLGSDDLAASYALPFTAQDTTLNLQYARNSASVVEAPSIAWTSPATRRFSA